MTKLVAELRTLPADDQARLDMTSKLATKLAQIGVLGENSGLAEMERIAASRFCRRRLSTVLVRLHFAENIEHALSLIEHGHIRIGPDLVTDPAVHVTREMEDHIAWAEGSTMKRKVREFNNTVDDFELMGN